MNVDSVLSTPDICINLISAYRAPDIRLRVAALYRSLILSLPLSLYLFQSNKTGWTAYEELQKAKRHSLEFLAKGNSWTPSG